MRQRSIELMDDEHVSALETLTPNNNHNVPAARVKRIMNPLTEAVIPGSMSLLRPARARRMSLWRSGSPPVREASRSSSPRRRRWFINSWKRATRNAFCGVRRNWTRPNCHRRRTRLRSAVANRRRTTVRSLQPPSRTRFHDRHLEPALRRMDERVRQSTSHRRAARSPHVPCPYSGDERGELSAQAIEDASAQKPRARRRAERQSRDRRNYPGIARRKIFAADMQRGPIGPLCMRAHAQLAWFCSAPAAGNRPAVDTPSTLDWYVPLFSPQDLH